MGNGNSSSHRKVTMRDVARHAQVAQSTVSRVLSMPPEPNGSNGVVTISPDTVKKVQEAVRELRYHPNLAARSLRGQKTQLIAVMIADIANPYYHQIVRKMQDVARQHKYDVLIANTDHLREYEEHFVEGLIRRPVDGVVLVPYHLTDDEIDSLMKRTGTAVVALGQHVQHPLVDIVYANDELATFEAISWLIHKKGHKRIGFVHVPNTAPGTRRYRGYARAMKAAGLPVSKEMVVNGDFSIDSGARAMQQLLKLDTPLTAVFACNDLMALGALSTLRERGISVPKDMAVIGYDNIPESTRSMPSLSTIAQFPADMAERLAEALFERIAGLNGPGRRFELPCKLILRDST